MAFSKMAGLAVTPRTPSSSIIRFNSPDRISLRPIRSSHGLCPNSFSLAAGFMITPTLLLRIGACSRGQPLRDPAGHLLRRQIVGVRQRLVRGAGAEPVDARSEEHTSELQSHSDLVCR